MSKRKRRVSRKNKRTSAPEALRSLAHAIMFHSRATTKADNWHLLQKQGLQFASKEEFFRKVGQGFVQLLNGGLPDQVKDDLLGWVSLSFCDRGMKQASSQDAHNSIHYELLYAEADMNESSRYIDVLRDDPEDAIETFEKALVGEGVKSLSALERKMYLEDKAAFIERHYKKRLEEAQTKKDMLDGIVSDLDNGDFEPAIRYISAQLHRHPLRGVVTKLEDLSPTMRAGTRNDFEGIS